MDSNEWEETACGAYLHCYHCFNKSTTSWGKDNLWEDWAYVVNTTCAEHELEGRETEIQNIFFWSVQ